MSMEFSKDGQGRLLIRFGDGAEAVLPSREQLYPVTDEAYRGDVPLTHAMIERRRSGEYAIRLVTEEEARSVMRQLEAP